MSQSRQAAQVPSQAAAPFACTVVIPLYDKGAYVERALHALAAQTLPPREVVVVDDGSRDEGPARVERFAAAYPFVRLLRQANAGVSAARNRGIAAATSEWVAFLDADDAYMPWFIEELAQLAQLFPHAATLATSYREHPSDFATDDLAARLSDARPARAIVHDFYDRWWHGNFFFTSSVCVRRAQLHALGQAFPVGEQAGEDLDLFFRLAESAPIAFSSRVSSIYAVGIGDSLSATERGTTPQPAFQRLLARTRQPGFSRAELAGARRCLATKWLSLARICAARGDIAAAGRLMRHPITVNRPGYWVRTAAHVLACAARHAARRSPEAPAPTVHKGSA